MTQISSIRPAADGRGMISADDERKPWLTVVVGIEQGSIERGFATVKAYTRPRLLQAIAQVVLACDEVNCPGLGFVRAQIP